MSQRYFLTAESTYEDLRQSLNAALAYPNALGKSVFQTALYAPRDNLRRVLLAVDTDLPGYATVAATIAPLLDSDAMEEIDEATYLAALASATGGEANFSSVTDTLTYVNFLPTGGSLATALSGIDSAISGKAAASHTHSPLQIIAGTDYTWDNFNWAPEETLVDILLGVDIAVSTKAALSHAHSATADLTFAGATAGQVLKVNSTASGLEWGQADVDVLHDTVSSTTYTGRAAPGSATSASVWKIRKTVYSSAGAVSSTATATNVKWNDRLTASYS